MSSSEERPLLALRLGYTFRRGEPGEEDKGGYRAGGRSDREDVEEVRDLDRTPCLQDSKALMVGEGSGVISSMAAI